MSKAVTKGTRVAVVAALAGMLVFATLGAPAGAGLQSFTSKAEGYALRVTVDLRGLPAAVKSALDSAWASLPSAVRSAPGFPQSFPYVIDQTFIKTSSDASATVTKARAVLGDGFAGNLGGSVEADAVGKDQSYSLASQDIPKSVDPSLTDVSVLKAVAGLLRSSVAEGPKVDANGVFGSLQATLANLFDQLPAEVKDPLTTAMGSVIDTVNGAITTANSTIDDTVVPAVVGALPSQITQDPVLGPIVSDATTLASNVNIPTIPATANPITSMLAAVSDFTSKTTAQRSGDLVSADSVSSIKAVDVLGDFLKVGLVTLASHSEAAGTKGSAKNTSSCSLADVRIGGNSGASFDGKNLFVHVNGAPVALPVPADQVDAVKAQVDSLLSKAGLSVSLCDAAQAQAAPDGTSASQSVSAFRIVFQPRLPDATAIAGLPNASAVNDALAALGLSPGSPLGVTVTIDPTVSTAVQAAPAAPVQLPRTGAPALATLAAGLVLAGGGLALRRRVR